MAYLSLSNKLSINRIAQVTNDLSGCGKETFELHLEFGNHIAATSNTPTPFNINRWRDSSGKGRDYVQLTEASQPRWTGHGYNFDGANENLGQNLGTAIVLDDEFTIGFAIKLGESPSNLVTIADASSADDFIRIKNAEQIEIKADGQLRTVDLNGSLPDGDPVGIVIQRTALGSVRIYVDGVTQTDTAAFTGSKPLDIDTVGCRNSQINDFIGDIGEIIIYSCSEQSLVTGVIDQIDNIRVQMIQ